VNARKWEHTLEKSAYPKRGGERNEFARYRSKEKKNRKNLKRQPVGIGEKRKDWVEVSRLEHPKGRIARSRAAIASAATKSPLK